MIRTARPGLAALFAALLAVSLASTAPAAAQTTARRSQQPSPEPRVESQGRVDANAEQTREMLYGVLEDYPPSLATVLKLDTSLLTNSAYLEPYPALATFLAEHPEVARNPDYFFARISGGGYAVDARTRERREAYEMLGAYLAGFAVFVAFVAFLGIVVWLIKTVLDQRRWNRLSKIQAEVHTKLMDRLASNDELLTYVQTPSGRRFLESGPSPLPAESAAPAIGAPFSRILWSVQAGVVLTIAGIGLMLVSRRFLVDSEPAHFFFVIGMLTLALGAGFVVSAAAAYAISRKLGLVDRPAATDHA
jgi:hypothetical protein